MDLGSDRNKDVKLTYPLHPMLRRAYNVLEPMFIESILPAEGHSLLAKQELWEALLDTMPEGSEAVRDTLKEAWAGKDRETSPLSKWKMLKMHIEAFVGRKSGQKKSAKKVISSKQQDRIECWPYEVVFRYTYPRLDINVSKKRNHLLKSPFCVHPKTGRVCVPIEPHVVESFDPFAVPTLRDLMKELDEYDKLHPEENDAAKSKTSNWEKTSLKSYYEPYQKDFLEPLQKEIRRQERDASEEEAAVIGDF